MCLYIIHFLLAVNYDKKVVQTHFLLLFVNKKYPETYILLWKGGWFWLFTHFANKKPSASPRAFYCCKMCKKSKSPPFLYYKMFAIVMLWGSRFGQMRMFSFFMMTIFDKTFWWQFSDCWKIFRFSDFFLQIFWKFCDLTLDTWDTDYIADNWEQQY